MGKDGEKSQIYISNEGLCGPSIPITREEFEEALAKVIKEEFGDEQKPKNNDGKPQPNDKPKDKPQQ